jgi:hypothetical protein
VTIDEVELLGSAALGDSLARVRALVRPRREVGGWATVELDRAGSSFGVVAEATGSTKPGRDDSPVAARDDLLGATVRLIRTPIERDIVLLEPYTEGRLAAALARFGEGFTVLYLIVGPDAPARVIEAGLVLTTAGTGPFGPEYLLLAGPRWGPFVILAGLN